MNQGIAYSYQVTQQEVFIMGGKRIEVAVIGAGGRGRAFGEHIAALPQYAEVVAVAEPDRQRREIFAERHNLQKPMVFDSAESFLAQGKLCDALIIATMDQKHVGPAVACTDMGYHMLLEKPMATTLEDCRAIAAAQTRAGTITSVCHSLRYHKGMARVQQLVAEGSIGDVMTIDVIEQVAWWHQAHSFVRGNWGREGESAFMLLAKSCHDIDYIAYLAGVPCRTVSSFGELSYFKPDNAPEGSTQRCIDCPLEADCKYSAIRHYVNTDRARWPAAVVSEDHSAEAHLAALADGPYGRCVWKSGNDVVDHQIVNLAFDRGIMATFTMTAFTGESGRRVRVTGTEGQLDYSQAAKRITIQTFADNNTTHIDIAPETGGHGGGDRRVVRTWLNAVKTEDPGLVLTDVHESLRTHSIVFAAERARVKKSIVHLPLAENALES